MMDTDMKLRSEFVQRTIGQWMRLLEHCIPYGKSITDSRLHAMTMLLGEELDTNARTLWHPEVITPVKDAHDLMLFATREHVTNGEQRIFIHMALDELKIAFEEAGRGAYLIDRAINAALAAPPPPTDPMNEIPF